MTANDSDVSDGDTLTGSQVVRVYGENLTAPFVTLTFGGVEYTPLGQGEDYIEYIIDDNGTATISVDGNTFMSMEVEGNVVPEGLPCRMDAGLSNNDSSIYRPSELIHEVRRNNVKCIQYPYKSEGDYTYFAFHLYFIERNNDNFTFVNCTLNGTTLGTLAMGINVSVLDSSKVAWIEWKGFIIAVFNYTTD